MPPTPPTERRSKRLREGQAGSRPKVAKSAGSSPAGDLSKKSITLNIASWNMQRRNKDTTSGHFQALQHLCSQYEVVYLQEVGKWMRDALEQSPNGKIAGIDGTFIMDSRIAQQSESSGCFNAIFCRSTEVSPTKVLRVQVNSGADDAARRPAAAVLATTDGQFTITSVSAHATSGGGGSANSQAIVEAATEQFDTIPLGAMSNNQHALIVGGDMNATHMATGGVFAAPLVPTHSSGRTLDGFFVEPGAIEGRDINVVTSVTSVGGPFSLETRDPTLPPHVSGPEGCYFDLHGANHKVSDHTPIVASAVITSTLTVAPSDESASSGTSSAVETSGN